MDEAETGRSRDSLVGTIFEKRYELLSLLGAGASGTAYKARDVFMERIVVVKVLHRHLLASPQAVERFRKEAVTTTGLDHHGIIQVYSHGVAEDGRPYMVMDCLEGQSLAQVLQAERKLAPDRFFNLFLQIVEALNFAHGKGVVHRDIKPSNIIIAKEDSGERAVIVDFGIARVLSETGDESSTKTGALLGASAYMSPEQCKGTPVDERSDIYSLGCVMFESLLGRAPFQGQSQMEVMYKHLAQSAGRLPGLNELPGGLAKILSKCLEREPAARYQSLAELKADLQKCFEMQDTIKRPWFHATCKKLHFRRFAIAGVSILAVGTLVGSLVFKYWSPGGESAKTGQGTPGEAVPLPRSLDGIRGMVDLLNRQRKFDESGNLLRKWKAKNMSNSTVPENAKDYVLQSLTARSIQLNKLEDVPGNLAMLDRLQCPVAKLYAAHARAEIFRRQRHPDKGIAEIDRGLRGLPEVLEPDAEFLDNLHLCYLRQGDCYFDHREFQKALNSYYKALEVRNQGQHYIEGINTRIKIIVALTVLGKTEQSAKTISECLKSAVEDRQLIAARESEQRAGAGYLTNENGKSKTNSGSLTLPSDQILKRDAAIFFYTRLSREFLEKGDTANFRKYSDRVIDLLSQSGQTDKGLNELGEQVGFCRFLGDFRGAIVAQKRLLADSKHVDFQTKLSRLVFLAQIYTYQLHQFDQAHDYEDRAYNLIMQEINKEPDLLFEGSDIGFSEVLRCMFNSKRCSVSEMKAKVELFIGLCKSHDCETLRRLYFLKADCLTAEHKIDESLVLCRQRVNYFQKHPAENEGYLYQWLLRETENQIKKGRLEAGLQSCEEALKVASELCSRTGKPEAKEAAPGGQLLRRDALTRTAEVLALLGRYQEAQRYFSELADDIGLDSTVDLDDADIGFLLRCAQFSLGRGDFAKAALIHTRIEQFVVGRQGVDCEGMIPVLYQRAEILKLQKKIPESRRMFEKVRSLCLKYGLDRIDDARLRGAEEALAAKD